MTDAGQSHVDVIEAAVQEIADQRSVGHVREAEQQMSSGCADAPQIGQERPRLVEMLDRLIDVVGEDETYGG